MTVDCAAFSATGFRLCSPSVFPIWRRPFLYIFLNDWSSVRLLISEKVEFDFSLYTDLITNKVFQVSRYKLNP